MWALIQDGKVHELFIDEPVLNSNLDVRNVSSVAGVSVGWIVDGGTIAAPPPVVVTVADLKAYAANARWMKEVGGIAVSGVPIATDDRSKQMILGARIAADADANFETTWVGEDGNIYPLTAAQVIGISNAVLAHVQSCFGIFASVTAAIDAVTITTKAQVDAAF